MTTHALKLGLIALTAILVAASIYTWLLIQKRQAALQDVSRYNSTWLVSQAAMEVTRLTTVLAGFGHPGSSIDADEVQLRLDIVYNRLKILTDGEPGAFILSRPDLRSILTELEVAMATSAPVIESLRADSPPLTITESFFRLLPKLNHLAAAVHERGSVLVAQDLRGLEKLGWLFCGLLVGLIFCSLGLIAYAQWNFRMLQVAHREVSGLAREAQIRTARFDAALNNMSQGLCMGTADLKLVVCNDRFREMFGLRQPVPAGTSIQKLYEVIAGSGEVSADFVHQLVSKHTNLIGTGMPARTLHEANGLALALAHEPMRDGGWVTTYEDITEQRKAEARLRFIAEHDVLTGLLNRLQLRERLAAAITDLEESPGQVTVFCLDLDRFKQINDGLGHAAGDALLKIVAARLSHNIAESDVVARLGGDEFVVFNCSKNPLTSAKKIADRIIDALGAPYDLNGQRVTISASIGIAQTRNPSQSPDLLLKNADIALYKAKSEGRGQFRFFEEAMEAEIFKRRFIETDLGTALESGELELYYQPSVDLGGGGLAGFEALLRWHHPKRGMIPPSEFIPIAEDTGQIVQIGAWVLHRACAEAARWPQPKRVAVNLSAVQFGRGVPLVKTVREALENSGLPPSLLELEITETVLLKNNASVLDTIHQLKALGVRIVLDDFGTGYSSLSYLRIFPFDKIKIDRSFVEDICEQEGSRAIIASVIQLATALGMTTTVEGVENPSQLTALMETGCTEVQGFLFGIPLPNDQLGQWFNLESAEADHFSDPRFVAGPAQERARLRLLRAAPGMHAPVSIRQGLLVQDSDRLVITSSMATRAPFRARRPAVGS